METDVGLQMMRRGGKGESAGVGGGELELRGADGALVVGGNRGLEAPRWSTLVRRDHEAADTGGHPSSGMLGIGGGGGRGKGEEGARGSEGQGRKQRRLLQTFQDGAVYARFSIDCMNNEV